MTRPRASWTAIARRMISTTSMLWIHRLCRAAARLIRASLSPPTRCAWPLKSRNGCCACQVSVIRTGLCADSISLLFPSRASILPAQRAQQNARSSFNRKNRCHRRRGSRRADGTGATRPPAGVPGDEILYRLPLWRRASQWVYGIQKDSSAPNSPN